MEGKIAIPIVPERKLVAYYDPMKRPTIIRFIISFADLVFLGRGSLVIYGLSSGVPSSFLRCVFTSKGNFSSGTKSKSSEWSD